MFLTFFTCLICNFRRILIDAGEPDKPQYISLLKTELSRRKAVLSDIFITHWHSDHVGGVPDVCREVTTGTLCHKMFCILKRLCEKQMKALK